MQKKIRNKYLRYLLNMSFITPVMITPISLSINNTTSSNHVNVKTSNQSSFSSLDFNWTNNTNSSIANHIIPSSYGKAISYDTSRNSSPSVSTGWTLTDTIQQDSAYDERNTSFATITSSSSSSSDFKYDQISKYWLSNVGDYSGTNDSSSSNKVWKASVPGTMQWVVKKSDLASKIGATDENTKFLGMTYSSGGYGLSKSLFVILKAESPSQSGGAVGKASSSSSVTGTFLFQIKWENDTNDSTNGENAGSYRLVKKLDDSINYNFIQVESPGTHSLLLYELNEFTQKASSTLTASSSTNGNLEINYLKLANSDFGNENNLDQKYKYTINQEYINKFTENDTKYIPVLLFYDSSLGTNVYAVYQAINYNKNKKILFSISLKRDITANHIIQESDNAIKSILSTGTLGFDESKPFKTSFVQNDSSSFHMFFSQKEITKASDSKIGYYKYDFLDETSENNINLVEKSFPFKKEIFLDIKKLYNATSSHIGYIFLTTSGIVYKSNNTLTNFEILCDFNSFSYKLGNIYKIATSASSSNWYAQMTDGTYGQFSNSTLIGQWDKISVTDSYELPLSVTIKTQNEVSPAVIYQQIANEDNSAYGDKFNSFLNNAESYKEFLTVNFVDSRTSTPPQVKITASNFIAPSKREEATNKEYKITLTFEQTLRKIDNLGQIVHNTSEPEKKLKIAEQTYIFNNNIGKVTFANDKDNGFDVPKYITNKLPSKVTKNEIETFLVHFENVKGYTITHSYNDLKGTMKVRIHVPYMWRIKDNGEIVFDSNVIFNQSFDVAKGYEEETDPPPFFNSNPLGVSASITEINDDFINLPENIELKNNLFAKYSTLLPSQVSKKQIIESFIIFGQAFYNQTNIDRGIIQLPEESQVSVVPYDYEGYAKINIVFPKIANLFDVSISFNTAKLFLSNQTANSSVYFNFKSNEEILSTNINASFFDVKNQKNTPTNLSSLKPTVIAKKLNTNEIGDNSNVIETLKMFAVFSDFFVRSINDNKISVISTPNDKFGSLKVQLKMKSNNGETIQGFNSDTIEMNFTGFTKDNSDSLTADSFTFSNITQPISNISVNDVDLQKLYQWRIFENSKNETLNKINERSIVITRSPSTGTIMVTLDIENFVEGSTVIPSKSFSKVYNGFLKTKNSIDMVVWKSFDELIKSKETFVSSKPSEIVNLYNNSVQSSVDKLRDFAHISSEFAKELTPGNVVFLLIPDDEQGSLRINATITTKNGTFSVNNEIKGFLNSGFLVPTIEMTKDNNSSTDIIQLKKKLPSAISKEDAVAFYKFKNADSYYKNVTLTSDDYTGTLIVSVEIIDTSNQNQKIAEESQMYTDFAKFIPEDKKTNWFIVAAAGLVPLVILIVPIILLGLVQSRKNMKKIAKNLNKRLNEEYDKKKKW